MSSIMATLREQMKEGDVDEAEESIALAKQLVDRVIDESKAAVDAAAEAKELAEQATTALEREEGKEKKMLYENI